MEYHWYIYGYVQDLESGMWQYIILDVATGETVFTMDVSNKYGYNNMAIGMYAGNSGNAFDLSEAEKEIKISVVLAK